MILRGRHFLNGELYDFVLGDGRIQRISSPCHEREVLGGNDYWVAPGLIDIQVNGYEGVAFCSSMVDAAGVARAADRLASAGVTAFCPTLTTGPLGLLKASLAAIDKACSTYPSARERIVGIHLEGPYISPQDGPRGAHPLRYVRVPNWSEFAELQAVAGGRIRLVTIAPELPGALEFIVRAREAGVVVAIGHHAATRAQIDAAVAAGATLSTHLGNGSHSQLPRHNNYIWEQLAQDALTASIIVDGHHLPPAVVKTFYRAKGVNRLILISDAISAVGMAPGRYKLMDLDVEVGVDGAARLCGTPYLAGSVLKLCDAIGNVMRFAGVSFADAVTMATANPARLLGLDGDRGCLRIGGRADMAVFRTQCGSYNLALTVVGGEICHRA